MSKPGIKYTEQELDYIRENWQQMSDRQIAEHLGRGVNGIKSKRYNMGLTQTNHWSAEEVGILKRHYADTSNSDLQELLPDRDEQAIYHKAYTLRIHKDPEWLNAKRRRQGKRLGHSPEARATRFGKGHTPFNKGMKRSEFMSREAIEVCKQTQFAEGHTPANEKYDGAISIRHNHPDRGEPPYMFIRLAKNNWVPYHRHLWKKHRGEIPEGRLISFKNGNSMDCRLDNLECITKAEHARRNRDHKKMMKTMNANQSHPSKDLSDAWVASMAAGHDEELKEYLLNERPDIIKLARASYRLNRKIHSQES
jgi:hypothetical protein